MQTEQFNARKIKCGGCVTTVRKNLLTLPGVESVEVTLPQTAPSANLASDSRESIVAVHGTNLSRDAIEKRLTELGYPVVG